MVVTPLMAGGIRGDTPTPIFIHIDFDNPEKYRERAEWDWLVNKGEDEIE